jgi:hypothetical protein
MQKKKTITVYFKYSDKMLSQRINTTIAKRLNSITRLVLQKRPKVMHSHKSLKQLIYHNQDYPFKLSLSVGK